MTKIKLYILRFIVFLLIFALMVFVINYFMSENPFYMMAHDAGASIQVWLDANGDGQKGEDESFLPDVCVWAGYASSSEPRWNEMCEGSGYLTDKNGAWSQFFPGGSCKEIYTAVNPPENYFPTTPVIVHGCNAEFGISQEKPASASQAINIGEYLQREVKKEVVIGWTKIGIAAVLVSVFAGFLSVKIVRS